MFVNIILNFKHNDVVPTGTTYNIYVGDKFVDGTKLYLYKYNMDSDSLDIVNENLAVEDGYVEVPTDFVIDDNFLRQNHLSTNIVLTKQMKDKLGI